MRKPLAFLILFCALVVVAPAAADDRPAPVQGRTAFGPITALASDSLSVQPEHGETLTCTVPVEKRAAFGALGLSVGQRVAIACMRRGDAYVLVRIATAPPRRVRSVEGVVTAVSADALTIAPPRGDAVTCAIVTAAAGGVAVGDRVTATCRFDGGRLVLVGVRRSRDRQTGPSEHVMRTVVGTVTAVSSDSLSVRQRNGETVVCRIAPERQQAVAALGLQPGDDVVAACRRDGDRWLLASVKRA